MAASIGRMRGELTRLTGLRSHRMGERQIRFPTPVRSLELKHLRSFIPKVFPEFGENEPVLFLTFIPWLTN